MKKRTIDLSGSKILIVDDIPTNLDVLSKILEEAGYHLLVATSGTAALEVAGHSGPDLLLLDVMMPGIDGFETCRRLKADPAFDDLPVVFLTARDDIEGLVEGFDAGGVDYIAKPFNKEELLMRVRTHLERAHFARGLFELNAHLEDKVAERTRQLQLKVRELEGKDRILRHMRSFDSLEKAMELVLEVVVDIVDLERAALCLCDAGKMQVAAATGYLAPGAPVPAEQLEQISITPEQTQAFVDLEKNGQPVRLHGDAPAAMVPIHRNDTVLGFIHVSRGRGAQPLTDDEVQTLESFALHASMAIGDALIRQDPDAWEEQLDEIIEIDDDVDDDALFDQLRRRLDH